uniref:Uncharacterized protein n=1 Tax=Magnetococcus massalia (strain MO-1) TaxID=451514 RepID=A0A1S7LPL4_MAGMO|nr:Protein of unknown function, putative sensor protein [Candidatus Magnetococcus massalia]
MDNRRILAVDDDEQLLQVYQEILVTRERGSSKLDLFMDETVAEGESRAAEQGYAVVAVPQGLDAVAAVEQALKQDKPFACAFVDVRMPPGIDGLETAKRIRDLDDRIYIIFVTAYSDKSVDEIQETVKHDVLLTRKPLTRDEVLQLARNACNSWNSDQQRLQEQQQLQEQLEEHAAARQAMESLVSSLSEGLVVCTEGGMITSVNPAAVAMSGYDEEDLLGLTLSDLFLTGDMGGLLCKANREGAQEGTTAELTTEAGEKRQIQLSVSPIKGSHGGAGSATDLSMVLVWKRV